MCFSMTLALLYYELLTLTKPSCDEIDKNNRYKYVLLNPNLAFSEQLSSNTNHF